MNKQLSLENIFLAIRLNCPVDARADRPLTLLKLPGKIRNTGVGRALFVYYALKSGHSQEDITERIRMTLEEFDGKKGRLNDFIAKGRHRFENDPNGPEDVYLFFYRKFLLVKSYLKYNHQWECVDDTLYT